jgi:hypothetical protein
MLLGASSLKRAGPRLCRNLPWRDFYGSVDWARAPTNSLSWRSFNRECAVSKLPSWAPTARITAALKRFREIKAWALAQRPNGPGEVRTVGGRPHKRIPIHDPAFVRQFMAKLRYCRFHKRRGRNGRRRQFWPLHPTARFDYRTGGCWICMNPDERIQCLPSNKHRGYCWMRLGYGKRRSYYLIHRIMFAWFHGVELFGNLAHTCGRSDCCNPLHLTDLGGASRNQFDRVDQMLHPNAQKRHCPRCMATGRVGI